MFRFTVLLSALFLCSVSAQSPDINKIVSGFIQELDEYIQKQNMSEIKLTPIAFDFGLANINIQGGSVKNLSSIELTDNSVSIKNDSTGTTLSFGINFDTLEIHFGMVKLDALFVNIDDDVAVSARENSISLGLKLKQDNGKCQVSIVQAETELGNFDVTLKDATDDTSSFIDSILGYFVEKALNLFTGKIESFLNPQLQNTLNNAVSSMDFSQMDLCQMVNVI